MSHRQPHTATGKLTREVGCTEMVHLCGLWEGWERFMLRERLIGREGEMPDVMWPQAGTGDEHL